VYIYIMPRARLNLRACVENKLKPPHQHHPPQSPPNNTVHHTHQTPHKPHPKHTTGDARPRAAADVPIADRRRLRAMPRAPAPTGGGGGANGRDGGGGGGGARCVDVVGGWVDQGGRIGFGFGFWFVGGWVGGCICTYLYVCVCVCVCLSTPLTTTHQPPRMATTTANTGRRW
jgi:hypothetical protein